MIIKYNQYVNEELNLFGALKNMFGKLLQNISDELKKPVEDLTAKLAKSKKEDMKKIMTDYLKIHNETLNKELAKVTTLPDLYKIIKDNLKAIYASIKAVDTSLGDGKFSLQNIFIDSNDRIKKLFDKDEKKFEANVNTFAYNTLIMFAKSKYNEKEIKELLPEKLINESVLNEIQNPNVQVQTNQSTGNQKDNPIKKDEAEIKNVQQDEKIKIISDQIKKWFSDAIYKKLNIKLKTDTNDVNQKGQIAFNTNNITGAKKIISTIQTLDKTEFAAVRDLLIKLGKGEKNDYGTFGDPEN